jgi:hypothetical protein
MRLTWRLRTGPFIAAAVAFAGICSGCTTGGAMSESSWTVAEIRGKTDADQAAIADVKSIFVEFLSDGRLRTSVKRLDGSVDREENETYKFEGNTLTIHHANYERKMTVTRTDNTMLVSSDRFNLKLERYAAPAEATQPAMFRPSSVGRGQFRSVSGGAGRK